MSNWPSSDPYFNEQAQLDYSSEPPSSAPPSAGPPSAAFPSSDSIDMNYLGYYNGESPMTPSQAMWNMDELSSSGHFASHTGNRTCSRTGSQTGSRTGSRTGTRSSSRSARYSTGRHSSNSDSDYGSTTEIYGTTTTLPDFKPPKRKRLSQVGVEELFTPSKQTHDFSEKKHSEDSCAPSVAARPSMSSPVHHVQVKTESTYEAPPSVHGTASSQEIVSAQTAIPSSECKPEDVITPDTSLHEYQFSPAANYYDQLPEPEVDLSSPMPSPLPPNLFYKTGGSLSGSYNLKYHAVYGVCPDNWLHPEHLQLVPAFLTQDLNDQMQSSEREEYEEGVSSYTERAFSYMGANQGGRLTKLKHPKYAEDEQTGQFHSLDFRNKYH